MSDSMFTDDEFNSDSDSKDSTKDEPEYTNTDENLETHISNRDIALFCGGVASTGIFGTHAAAISFMICIHFLTEKYHVSDTHALMLKLWMYLVLLYGIYCQYARLSLIGICELGHIAYKSFANGRVTAQRSALSIVSFNVIYYESWVNVCIILVNVLASCSNQCNHEVWL